MIQAFADFLFALVALEDSRTTDHLVVGKLEYDLLLRMPVMCKVDVARDSSSSGRMIS